MLWLDAGERERADVPLDRCRRLDAPQRANHTARLFVGARRARARVAKDDTERERHDFLIDERRLTGQTGRDALPCPTPRDWIRAGAGVSRQPQKLHVTRPAAQNKTASKTTADRQLYIANTAQAIQLQQTLSNESRR